MQLRSLRPSLADSDSWGVRFTESLIRIGKYFAVIVFLSLLVQVEQWMFPMEEEAVVKHDDCRKIVVLRERPGKDFFKTYSRDQSGQIEGGWCTHVTTSLISGVCEEADTYWIESRVKPPVKTTNPYR